MSDMTPEQTPIEPSNPQPVGESQPSIRLAEKHPLAIRWMHWINFPLLFIMIWSGLLIYWADSIPPGTHPGEVYRVGIGSWTLFRPFPDWFWKILDAPYELTEGLGYHFFSCGSSLQMASSTCSIHGFQGNGGIWFQTQTRSVKPGR
jgi:hypothetical protein